MLKFLMTIVAISVFVSPNIEAKQISEMTREEVVYYSIENGKSDFYMIKPLVNKSNNDSKNSFRYFFHKDEFTNKKDLCGEKIDKNEIYVLSGSYYLNLTKYTKQGMESAGLGTGIEVFGDSVDYDYSKREVIILTKKCAKKVRLLFHPIRRAETNTTDKRGFMTILLENYLNNNK